MVLSVTQQEAQSSDSPVQNKDSGNANVPQTTMRHGPICNIAGATGWIHAPNMYPRSTGTQSSLWIVLPTNVPVPHHGH